MYQYWHDEDTADKLRLKKIKDNSVAEGIFKSRSGEAALTGARIEDKKANAFITPKTSAISLRQVQKLTHNKAKKKYKESEFKKFWAENKDVLETEFCSKTSCVVWMAKHRLPNIIWSVLSARREWRKKTYGKNY